MTQKKILIMVWLKGGDSHFSALFPHFLLPPFQPHQTNSFIFVENGIGGNMVQGCFCDEGRVCCTLAFLCSICVLLVFIFVFIENLVDVLV